jgi:hypothetical protein
MNASDDDLAHAMAAEAELRLRLRLERAAGDACPLHEAMFGLRIIAEHATRRD